MKDSTFKEKVSEWTDWDWVACQLSICIGLFPDEPAFGGVKHVFWDNHPLGGMLYEMPDAMVGKGILEKRNEPDVQYRWNSGFNEDCIG